MRKTGTIVLIAVIAGVLIAAGVLLHRFTGSIGAVQHVERATLDLLKSERLLFLVTDRLVTVVLVESKEQSLLFGGREGFLIGKVNLLYGVNLEELSEKSVKKEENRVVVTVPAPKPLAFEVDLDSLRFYSKRSGLWALADWFKGADLRDELQKQFKTAGLKYMEDNRLLPKRVDIVKRLNGLAPLLSSHLGVPVEFR